MSTESSILLLSLSLLSLFEPMARFENHCAFLPLIRDGRWPRARCTPSLASFPRAGDTKRMGYLVACHLSSQSTRRCKESSHLKTRNFGDSENIQ